MDKGIQIMIPVLILIPSSSRLGFTIDHLFEKDAATLALF